MARLTVVTGSSEHDGVLLFLLVNLPNRVPAGLIWDKWYIKFIGAFPLFRHMCVIGRDHDVISFLLLIGQLFYDIPKNFRSFRSFF